MAHLVMSHPSSSGNHAQCYPHPKNDKKVLLATNCPVRRLMAKGRFPASRYFPKVRNAGKLGFTNVYELDKYQPITRESEKKLSKIDRKIFRTLTKGFRHNLEHLAELDIPHPVKNAIKVAYLNVKREGYKVSFDVCDHNMMMTQDNKLVFTDLFWIHKEDY